MSHDFTNSQLNHLIPPEIKNDQFYAAIQKIAREEDIKTVLEIGSSSGEGSTEALVTGLLCNPNKPTLFCVEVSKTRFAELKNRYANKSFVKCYNVSSVALRDFPNEEEVINFYKNTRTNLNFYPLERVLNWLNQDIDYIEESGVPEQGIKLIKQENNITFFDFVLIDGSEFTGSAELEQVYGAKYICLDDINTFKNNSNLNRLSADYEYSLIEINYNVRNGYAIFKKKTTTPVKYITIQSAIESIEGFMVPGQEEYLFNKVQSLAENAIIVEIGSYKGRSTVAMAYACVGTSRKIYCIDTWDGNDSDFPDRDFFDIWQQNVLKNDLAQYVIPLRGYSHQILRGWSELADEKAIDFIFIDGSHQYLDVLKDFELSFPLVKNGGWIALHDVVRTWPGPERVWHELAKINLINHEYSSTLACGQKVGSFITSSQIELPIHFFTIVLNGQPFIRYHIDVLKQLPFKWHWHIVEGVADLKHDTAWSTQLGGHVTDEIHRNGRSHDGTAEYLDEIAQQYPDQITIYRKPEGVFWDGKREMVNEPLFNIHEECLLWQIDTDEFWTLEQICTARQMFIDNPDKTAAFYWCWYFVGENLIISTRNCYAQNPRQEWLRTWRYKPGAVWVAHEPPILQEPLDNGQWRDIAAVNPFTHRETEQLNLIFQHFAYVTREQLLFKEQYYGYKNAASQWLQLQEQTKFPVFLREYFPWVGDETQVDSVSSYGIVPIAQKELSSNSWRFLQSDELQVTQIRKPIPRILVDGVFFQLYQTGIARVWKSLLQEWANNGFAQHIIVLDRAGTAPKISGIRYRTIPAYNYNSTDSDRQMLQQVCEEEGAELFISSYYTTPLTTPSLFLAHDMIPEIMGWDLSTPMWREKHRGIKHAAAYIAVSENTARDLVKCFPNISLDSVTVAKNGLDHTTFNVASQEKVYLFKNNYGIVKPYFILVGAGGGYKNSILFFQAFSQLASSYGFDIVCTGSGGILAPEWRAYTSGSAVHMLQLSDEELATAYCGAVALVYPSKYEGFGMPIIEAMACGCPVITCRNASIPEVAGEAAIYVNDDDVDGLVNALCEVQKPGVRKFLIAAGLEQAKEFSWTKMASVVSSVLIETSLQFINLKEINLILFPDWSQPEEVLALELQQVVKVLATHPESQHLALLIDTSNSVDDYAELLLSAVSMNLLMEDDLDISEGLEISLVKQLGKIQWDTLLPRIKARIVLENEDKQALQSAKAESLPCYELEKQAEGVFFYLSEKFFQEGRWLEAIVQYQNLLSNQVCEPNIYWRLSECYLHLNKRDEAFCTLREGIKLHPTDGNLHFSLIMNLRRSGRTQEAIECAIAASNALPHNYTFKLLKHLTVPAIYDNQEEITFYRQRYTQGLQALIDETSLKTTEEKQSALAGVSRLTNFYLSYQAQNDIELQRQYGKLLHEIMAANYPQWVTPLSMPSLKDKIRVGYVSHYLHSYSGTLWLIGWLRECNCQNFEIYCYYTGNSPDTITEQFQAHSDVFHHIPYNLEAVCQQITADQLHILVYPEIGMDPQTMQMAALRLAPVQCVAWGHPVTTGLATIDYFLSSELMEPENGQEHYSEKLIRLPNIGVSYPKPYIPPIIKTRSDYNLPEDAVLYLCCQAPFKYLPQYDFIFPGIACRVPQARFVFLRGELLQQRLRRAFTAVGLNSEDYCMFLTIPERLDYLMINLLCDVYLDTFTWSGGNTTLEAIACHLPVVTCPGEFMRGRHSGSFLKMLGVTNTIAQNETEYIEIAAKLGLDSGWRLDIKQRIKQQQDRLYHDKACVTGLETFYNSLLNA